MASARFLSTSVSSESTSSRSLLTRLSFSPASPGPSLSRTEQVDIVMSSGMVAEDRLASRVRE